MNTIEFCYYYKHYLKILTYCNYSITNNGNITFINIEIKYFIKTFCNGKLFDNICTDFSNYPILFKETIKVKEDCTVCTNFGWEGRQLTTFLF